MFSKLMIAALATFATALPAAALPTYSSSAPTFTAELITSMDTTPVLVKSNADARFYQSAGFLYYTAADQNMYVDRLFLLNRNSGVSVVDWVKIDCGRMLSRSAGGRVIENGSATITGETEWLRFQEGSPYANTCESAARDRGMTWTWYAQ